MTITSGADIPRVPARYGLHYRRAQCCSPSFTAPAFDPVQVNQDRRRPDADRMIVAELTGEARHHAKWRELIEDEEAAAVAGLRELAAGRADLLAEIAGIFEGTSEGELDEPLAGQAAELDLKARPTRGHPALGRGAAAPGRD